MRPLYTLSFGIVFRKPDVKKPVWHPFGFYYIFFFFVFFFEVNMNMSFDPYTLVLIDLIKLMFSK